MAVDEEIVEIIEPSQELFDLYAKFKKEILSVLPNSKVELIGSLAVPMAGKKELDIMVVTKDVKDAQDKLVLKGFPKGPIIDGIGYCRNRKQIVIVELHILPPGHKKIEQYREHVKMLQEDASLRKQFEALKVSLDKTSIENYKKEKSKFMKEHNLK